MNYQQMARDATNLVQQASQIACDLQQNGLQISKKQDGSTVTNADIACEKIIVEGLRKLYPHIPVISEEEHSAGNLVTKQSSFWLIDPIDSTSAYASGSDEYAICVGLITQGKPVLGIVGAPGKHQTYVGIVEDYTSYGVDTQGNQQLISVRKRDPFNIVAVESPSSVSYKMDTDNVSYVRVNSAIKFAWVAQGWADVYIRNSWLSEWDIAAGHALVLAAGGAMTDIKGQAISYDNPGLISPPFIATGKI